MKSVGALLTITILSLAACGERSAEVFSVGANIYSVPRQHLSSSTREPYLFLRIKHPERPYDLVYDGRVAGQQQAPGAPRLFSINDEDQSALEYRAGPAGPIICRKAVPPKGGCGMQVEHRGARWTLLFPIGRVDEAATFGSDALALLDRYVA